MTGKNRAQGAAAEVSPGGSLIPDAKLRQLYATMLQCRLLSEYAAAGTGEGRCSGLYAASIGQEAIAAGWVIDLEPSDAIALAPGNSIAMLVKGVPLADLLATLENPPKGLSHVLPASSVGEEQWEAVIATATANKRKKKRPVVVAFAPASATRSAAWESIIRKAARQKLPIVFVVENNPLLEPAPEAPAEPADDFTRKAAALGMIGIPVDGNDVVAMYRVAHESLTRVRQGDGPFMVEAKTYIAAGRGKRRMKPDPLMHMEHYLKAKKLFAPKWKKQLVETFTAELKRAAPTKSSTTQTTNG